MALFNFKWDLAENMREKEEQKQREAKRKRLLAAAALSGLNPSEQELAEFDPGSGVDPLRGVTGNNPEADLQAELRNEELNRAAEDNSPEVRAMRMALLMNDLGLDPSKFSDSRMTDTRREALLAALEELDAEQRANAANKLDVSSTRSDGGRLYNRFGGAEFLDIAPDVRALADKRGAEEDAAAALAAERRASTADTNLRLQALEGVLPELSPLQTADAANKNTLNKRGERVKVRQKDGTERFYEAIPQPGGTFRYVPIEDDAGAPIESEPSPGEGTALAKDTQLISELLDIPPNEAIMFKLQTGRKPPTEAWSDLIGRLVSKSYGVTPKPEKLREEAAKIWKVMRPGVPIPETTPENAPAGAPGGEAPPAGTESPEQQQDARERATAEGYTNLGNWVPGKGFEVFDDSGNLIGYYY